MDQASASLVASCARNPAVPKTSPSWRLSEDQSQIVVPPRDGSAPQFEPHSEPVHIAPRPSSPALCQSNAKGYLLPDFYSGCATGIPGSCSEGLLLRRVQLRDATTDIRPERHRSEVPNQNGRSVLAGDRHRFQIGERPQIAQAPNHVLGASELKQPPAHLIRPVADLFDHR